MDWNELIRIWGAGHPGEEPEIDAAAEGARRARARRRDRMNRCADVPPDIGRRTERPEELGPGEEARA